MSGCRLALDARAASTPPAQQVLLISHQGAPQRSLILAMAQWVPIPRQPSCSGSWAVPTSNHLEPEPQSTLRVKGGPGVAALFRVGVQTLSAPGFVLQQSHLRTEL